MPTNAELVRSLWEPMDGVNIAAVDWGADVIRQILGDSYSPEIELTTLQSGLGSGVGESVRGVDGLVSYLREWLEPFSEYYSENHDYIEVGDCVLVPCRQWGTGTSSGAKVEIELTHLFELRDGQVVRWHQYDTLAEARADAEGTEAD
jgi:ketosteroid isomerase-like protein